MGRRGRGAPVHASPPGTAGEGAAEDRMVAVFNARGRPHALDGSGPQVRRRQRLAVSARAL